MAGKRETLSKDPLKIRWTRYIDSFGEPGATDDGDFTKLPNGGDLESGSMISPDHDNKSTYYEELWREGPLLDAKPGSWIAESSDGETRARTWIGRLGGYYLAMRELDSKTNEFAALRQHWNASQESWEKVFTAGESKVKLPLVESVETAGFEKLEEGSEFEVDGVKYVLKAVGK